MQFDLDRSCLGSVMGRVDPITSTFINFFLREHIPESKLGDGGSVIGDNSLRWVSVAETYPVGSFNNTQSSIVI
jgi:hypothetical protein